MNIYLRFQVRNLLEALSGYHRGNMFDTVINDIKFPSSVWKITVGEELQPNIWMEMSIREYKLFAEPPIKNVHKKKL